MGVMKRNRNSFVMKNRNLSYWAAKTTFNNTNRMLQCGIENSDLLQNGMLGLIIAADKFDPYKGSFGTYGGSWARSVIIRAYDNGDLIRIPVCHKHVKKEKGIDFNFIQLEDCDEGLVRIEETIEDCSPNPEEKLIQKEQLRLIHQAMETLSLKERSIVRARAAGKTLEEVGEEHGFTRERARQLQDKAYAKIRKWISVRTKEALPPPRPPTKRTNVEKEKPKRKPKIEGTRVPAKGGGWLWVPTKSREEQ